MQRPNTRVRALQIMFAVASAALAACSPADQDPTADADRPTWVIVGNDVAADVVAFLEPTANRVVSAQHDRTILQLREAELDTLAGFFHDHYSRCGGFTAHDSLAEAQAVILQDLSA